MTDQYNWEKIDVPRGSFIGWGLRAGQKVVGVVVEFSPTGGRDFDQNPCPNVAIELVEEAWSANKAQQWTKHERGDLVQLNCGQVSLKRAVLAADLSPGDLVKVELENILFGQGKNGGDIKEFGIQVVRGFRAPSRSQSAPAQQPAFNGQPPQQPGPQFNGGQQAPTNYPPQQPNPGPPPQPAQSSNPWGAAPPPQQPQQQPPQPGFAPSAPGAPSAPPFGTGGTEPPPF